MILLAEANGLFAYAEMRVFQGLLQHLGIETVETFQNAEGLKANLWTLARLGQLAKVGGCILAPPS